MGWWGTKRKEKKNFCAHIIFKKWRIKCYLYHGGSTVPLPSDFSRYVSGPIHQSCPRSKLGSKEDYYVGLQISLEKVAAAFDIQYFNFMWSSLLHFATYVMCWVERKSLNVKALKWLMWEFHFTLKNVFP